ncbi:galactan 5-O-arabinofuranosyltransferase [Mycobacterium sp.]|uniref:galactan 5-O-arabinofuranosyltransferase n=1 Tax=Mycobacterium sp. TaxID=1785 RepID=UPI001271A4AB|nr:galactan 5-O-arabinofuranosyltransferase [Mycobacterium sp.]KAA8960482.1 MAG: arabinofuranosyltransferase [Mycobacterium sp.]
MRDALATLGQMVLAAAVAVLVAVVSLRAVAGVHWPAYPSSNQLHALTTVGQVGCLAGLIAAGWLWRRGLRLAARLLALVFCSAFCVVTLAMPLGATRLYLFGISVDQQFRTEYLTRLTDSPRLQDMTYVGLPPFYPPGWFWLGGRAAALSGTPAWEMYKPWAITSITIAVAVALVTWWRMLRFEYAVLVTIASAAVTLAYSSTEPYAAMITVLTPPVLVLAWSGLRAGERSGGWAAVLGAGLFLGFTATFYTLLFAYSAVTLALMALVLAAARRRRGLRAALDPLLRLAVIAGIAAAIGSITWLPFLLRAARSPVSNTGSALHYLPADGAVLSFPMLQFTLLGALCMLGTLWLAVRARTSARAGALAIGVLAVYLWSLLSMLSTLARTTLLSYRLQPTLTVLLATAGVFGFVDATLALARRSDRRVVGVAATVGLVGAIGFSQDIPGVLRPDLTVAYTDTDGSGHRGDRRPPGSERYYAAVDATITRTTGRPRDHTVVLTADYSFLSYYPYWGFQGLTSHYANPLAQFDKRAAAISSWSKLKTPAQFVHALDTLPWQPPTVFLMRHSGHGPAGSYTLRLAEDVYPNHPNVRRYPVDFSPELFAERYFTVTDIGPFVLAIRKP